MKPIIVLERVFTSQLSQLLFLLSIVLHILQAPIFISKAVKQIARIQDPSFNESFSTISISILRMIIIQEMLVILTLLYFLGLITYVN
jgi:hypothetical protein